MKFHFPTQVEQASVLVTSGHDAGSIFLLGVSRNQPGSITSTSDNLQHLKKFHLILNIRPGVSRDRATEPQ